MSSGWIGLGLGWMQRQTYADRAALHAQHWHVCKDETEVMYWLQVDCSRSSDERRPSYILPKLQTQPPGALSGRRPEWKGVLWGWILSREEVDGHELVLAGVYLQKGAHWSGLKRGARGRSSVLVTNLIPTALDITAKESNVVG
jgi:hypothetical protein